LNPPIVININEIKREISGIIKGQENRKTVIRSKLIVEEQRKINVKIMNEWLKMFSKRRKEVFILIKKEVLNIMSRFRNTKIRIFYDWRDKEVSIYI
jgi:hypothetical protein